MSSQILKSLIDKVVNILKIGNVTKVNGNDGELQDIQLKILGNIEDAMKVGNFGFNSKAPIDSRCIVAKIGNENIVIANEHIASIIDVASGNSIMYNQNGDYVKVEKDLITVKATNVEITSNTLTHNGTNVGETHTHDYTWTDPAGSGTTDEPN